MRVQEMHWSLDRCYLVESSQQHYEVLVGTPILQMRTMRLQKAIQFDYAMELWLNLKFQVLKSFALLHDL